MEEALQRYFVGLEVHILEVEREGKKKLFLPTASCLSG